MAGGNVNFTGKYKCYKNDNFEEYMKATGAGMIVRKMANKTSPEVDITQDGDHFIIITKTGPSTTKWDFTVGTEYETDGAGGSGKVKNQPKWDGGKLVIYSEFVKGTYKPSLATREITSDGDLLVTLECEGVVAKRHFKKQ